MKNSRVRTEKEKKKDKAKEDLVAVTPRLKAL